MDELQLFPYDSLDLEMTTRDIRTNIGTADLSGKSAWKAGELLNQIKEQKAYFNKFESFERYCEKEFGKSLVTINQYIEIFKSFNYPDISSFTLIAHLKKLIEIADPEKRQIATGALKGLEPEEASGVRRPPYTTEDLNAVVDYANNTATISSNEVKKKLIHEIKTNRKPRDLVGKRLQTKRFSELGDIFFNEPIDEQGTVALFCTLFPFIKRYPFEWEGRMVTFGAIEWFRSRFPDAAIRIDYRDHKQKQDSLKIEFEYASKTFFHGHNHNPDKCDMIICWLDNFTGQGKPDSLKILEIKGLLDTGLINLR